MGIDGKDVVIKEIGEKDIEITIPKFVFIGYDDPEFEFIVDKNGVLSFTTENIDTAAMITKVLKPEKQEEYIEYYKPLLKESTEVFYKNLLPSFDNDVMLTFKYEA